MKKAVKHTLIITLGIIHFASPSKTFGQLRPQNLRVAFYNEAIAVPSLKVLNKPLHPTLNIGSDFMVKYRKHFHQSLGMDAYMYHHKTKENAIMLDATYRFGYHFNCGLQVNLISALGFKHASLTGEKFEQNETGAYEQVSYSGKSMANLKLGAGLAYPISPRYLAFINYKTMLSGPSGGIFIPFDMQTFFGGGIQFNFIQE